MPRLSFLSRGLARFLLCGDLGGPGLAGQEAGGSPWRTPAERPGRGVPAPPGDGSRSSSAEACLPGSRGGGGCPCACPPHPITGVSPRSWRLESPAPGRGGPGAALRRDARRGLDTGPTPHEEPAWPRGALLGDPCLHPCPVHFSAVAVGLPAQICSPWWIVKE